VASDIPLTLDQRPIPSNAHVVQQTLSIDERMRKWCSQGPYSVLAGSLLTWGRLGRPVTLACQQCVVKATSCKPRRISPPR
jgi:hypothetical protein